MGSSKQFVLLDYNTFLLSFSREWSNFSIKLMLTQSDADGVIVPEIHCPCQTIILLCSDTSPLNDWDLDLQTPDLFHFNIN